MVTAQSGAVRRTALGVAALSLLSAAGCTPFWESGDARVERTDSTAAVLVTPVDASTGVAPDEPVTVGVGDGRLTEVSLAGPDGKALPGHTSVGGGSWITRAPLAYNTAYTVTATAVDPSGKPVVRKSTFTTLTPKVQIGVKAITPDAGSTVGVGMPLTVTFDTKVPDDRAVRTAVERRLAVTAKTATEGAWQWTDAKTAVFRPKEYWPADSKISVATDLTGIPMGDGVYGKAGGGGHSFSTGSAVIATVDSGRHQMTVRRNGEVLETIPVTTGKPGFTTRSGRKVVIGKERHVRMNGETIGIAADSSEGYDLDVDYAVRVTWSGEFVHAAPWSVGSQGRANVSHGCVGMSTANARWFFNLVSTGDVVEVVNTGSRKTMETSGNGHGEWNIPWEEWVSASNAGAVKVEQAA